MKYPSTLTQHLGLGLGLGRAVRRGGWSPAASIADAAVASHPFKRLATAF